MCRSFIILYSTPVDVTRKLNVSGHFFFLFCGGTLGAAAATGLLYQPRMIGDGDCGQIGGINRLYRVLTMVCNTH
jgi:hypothetical protein